MRTKIKNGIPAFLAISVFATAEMITMFEIISEHQRYNFEIICNISMLIVAVLSFFLMGLPISSDSSYSPAKALSNIAVSAVAFTMNIDVFEHTFRSGHFLEDFRGWHICWAICAALQIIFLTRLGKTLLLKTGCMAKTLEVFFSELWHVLSHNKIRFIILTFGITIWGIFFGALCSDKNASAILSDIKFWESSLLLWIYYLILVLMINLLFHIVPKIAVAVQNASGKAIVAITLILIIAILANVLPALLQALTTILCIPVFITGMFLLIIRRIGSNNSTSGNERTGNKDINSKDAFVVLLCFIVIPLVFIFLITFLKAGNSNIIAENPTSVTAWLDFMGTVAEMAEAFFDLFR